MVHVSLRQKRLAANDRTTFERHTSGPGSPLTEIPGDGFYDWAGRRLFMPDGAPDPNTPGAYRYQHDPDCTDLTAPESDPANPRYEPPHLRHRPGDTWEIGGKPYDPADPGPYGTPGWHQDRRTGRHRRNELPDPLPPEAEEPTWPNPVPRLPIRPDRPRPRHEPEPEQIAEEPYRFTKLQEDAWERWLVVSQELADAHTQQQSNAFRRAITAVRQWISGILTTKAPTEPATPEPLLMPRTGNGYSNAWELHAHHPAAGGGAA